MQFNFFKVQFQVGNMIRHGILPPWKMGDLKFSPNSGGSSQMGSLKFSTLYRVDKEQSLIKFVCSFQVKSNFSVGNIFFQSIISIKWSVIYRYLKVTWNSHALFYVNIIEKGMSQSLHFFYCLLKTVKLFNKCVICYFHYLKSILNDDSCKEYISPVVFVNLKHMQ